MPLPCLRRPPSCPTGRRSLRCPVAEGMVTAMVFDGQLKEGRWVGAGAVGARKVVARGVTAVEGVVTAMVFDGQLNEKWWVGAVFEEARAVVGVVADLVAMARAA